MIAALEQDLGVALLRRISHLSLTPMASSSSGRHDRAHRTARGRKRAFGQSNRGSGKLVVGVAGR